MKILLFSLYAFSLCANYVYLPDFRCEKSDFYTSFNFLFWKASERGLEFASKNGQSFFDQDVQLYRPSFEFHPAFRVGAGYHLPYENWDIELTYTFYYAENQARAHQNLSQSPGGGIRPIWTSAVAFQNSGFRTLWQDAKVKWKLHSNLFDLYLKQRLWLTSAIAIEPAFGLKLALLQQRYKVIYQNGNTAFNRQGTTLLQFMSSTIAMNNRSFNIGPAASIGTRWNLSKHFDFLANLSSSLLASHFGIKRNEFDVALSSGPNFDSLRQRDSYWLLRPQAGTCFGLSFTNWACTAKRAIYYGLLASYEAQVYWKQNMLYRSIDWTNPAMLAPAQGDLFFYGLTLEAFVDF